MLELVLGGARSGKSAYAEHSAQQQSRPVYYIATAQALDAEMQKRIQRHKSDRPVNWQTIEEPVELGQCLARPETQQGFVIVDCLTLWMTNLLALPTAEKEHQWNALFAALDEEREIIFVSNEVSMGVVPLGEQTRRFVDDMGRLHQKLAALCQRVTLMVAGIPHLIKSV